MSIDLASHLAALDDLLAPHPPASGQLRPPAGESDVRALCELIGVETPDSLVTLYGWHGGTYPSSPDQVQICLFPRFWEFLSLERVQAESFFAVQWCRDEGIAGIPFAKHETGMFLVAEAGREQRVWVASFDFVRPAWPDGTMLGLVRETAEALNGNSSEFFPTFNETGFEWIPSDGAEY